MTEAPSGVPERIRARVEPSDMPSTFKMESFGFRGQMIRWRRRSKICNLASRPCRARSHPERAEAPKERRWAGCPPSISHVFSRRLS
jgi:hypothetical protein